jgi:poly(A) polymerase
LSDINPGSNPRIIARPDHIVSRSMLSRNALKVLYRLNQAGFQAFLVGGGVRDLLLETAPKDFDVVTDAHPEQVRKLFRNCRLIGRRFRLAHVHFGPEVIEVATFRAMRDPARDADEDSGDEAPATSANGGGGHIDRVVDDSGRILRDNVYGSIEEDVWRRDFTANALYYNIDDFSIWDYVGGAQDIADRTLRMIGDPVQRYAEDPVRLLRAMRFAGKLDFSLHPDTARPIRAAGPSLLDVPPARLLDESIKLLMGGAGQATMALLREYDLLQYLFPMTDQVLSRDDTDHDRRMIEMGLANSDRRLAQDKPVTPIFLFCVLLWSPIRDLAMEFARQSEPHAEDEPPLDPQAVREATFEIVSRQQGRVSIPRRFAQSMSDILTMQPRFHHLQGRHAHRLYDHPRFRAAWDFLLLRYEAGEPGIAEQTIDWWREVQAMETEQAHEKLSSGGRSAGTGTGTGPRRKRRRRRGGRGRTRGPSDSGARPDGATPPDGGGDA